MKKTFTVLLMVLLAAMLIVSCDNKATEPESKGYTGKTYEVGKEGPSGGTVFYDKGYESDGWRYLEVAPEDLGLWSIGELKDNAETTGGIGAGDTNTTAFEGYLVNASSTKAFTKIKEYKVTKNGVDYTGWYLPTEEELKAALPYFTVGTNNYWTSSIKSKTEVSRYSVTGKVFSAVNPKNISCQILCIRKF